MENLSLSQKQVILGGLLGDASFQKEKKIVSFSQSEKQLEYLTWKYNFFNIDKEIKSAYNTFQGKSFLRYYFYFYIKKVDESFYSFLCKNLYSNSGRKKISLKYLNELTPLGLAVWWMDDGSLCNSKGNRWGKLCTECFNWEEHILLKKYFKEKWDIEVKITQKKNKYYFINFNATALKKIIAIIYPYVIQVPSMIYKIEMNYKYEKSIGEDFKEIYWDIKKHLI